MAMFGEEVAVEGWEEVDSKQKFRLTFELLSSVSSCKPQVVFILGDCYPLAQPSSELVATGLDRREHAILAEVLRRSVKEAAGRECMAEVMQQLRNAHDDFHEARTAGEKLDGCSSSSSTLLLLHSLSPARLRAEGGSHARGTVTASARRPCDGLTSGAEVYTHH
eukprot:753913-Hanusia_phi.AAC.3